MAGDTNVGPALTVCYHALKLAYEEKTTSSIANEQFRTIIGCCQKLIVGGNTLLPPILTDIAEIVLQILAENKLSFDTQSLGSTALCLNLSLIQEPLNVSIMFSKVIIPASHEPFIIKPSKVSEVKLTLTEPETFKLCLCHGLLQLSDSFWSCEHLNWNYLMYHKMFPLLESICFQSNHLTLLAFKCLFNWLRKVNSCGKASRNISADLTMRVMNIVITNWENPMNGVREQNSMIFEELLVTTDSFPGEESHPGYLKSPALLDLVLTEQSWMMKSKYFLLSVILPKCGVLKSLLQYKDDIVHGLLNSLAYTHLASAGAELYKVCLESLALENWQQIFLQPIVNILISTQYTLQKQNIFNYWVSSTIKKFKLSWDLLYETLKEEGNGKDILLPMVCLLKIGRKEGYETMQWQKMYQCEYFHQALVDSNEIIRSHAFAAVCISSKTSISPTDEEFSIVEKFLTQNINADHSALRQNMLSNFTVFLCRVRDACLQVLKTKYHNDPSQFENRALTRSMIFLEWVYNFLKGNLEVGSNYQRKYTSLEIYKIVLSYLNNDSHQSNTTHRKVKIEGYKVMKYAIAVGKWSFTSEQSREILLYCVSDPSEDVRESAAFILTSYFKFSESEAPRFCELYKKALSLCSDMMFFHAESGALLVQVITSLAYKNGGPAGLKGVNIGGGKEERVCSSLLSIAESQGGDLRADLLKAASQGSPLHGILTALTSLTTLPSSPEYSSLTQHERHRLLSLVELTVKHLLQVLASKTANISDYAPSFCEMGEAIESAVEESTVNIEESDKLQLSPAYQLVLNCIWLNLRACCKVASGLVSSHSASLSEAEVERCWSVSASVLRQCRHKGALEVAGSSLATIASGCGGLGGLPSLLDNRVLQPALSQLVDHRLHSPSDMTQTSRGAGNVILIHRLIASDPTPNKSWLHRNVPRLVSIMNSGGSDLPQVMLLLTSLVQDSSLAQDMARYKHTILLNCLANLSYPLWPVRNAALQLFGAIVPKLIGQRKRQEDDSGCSCYHLAYEELLYHARPSLVSALLDQLDKATTAQSEDTEGGSSLESHSQLVPVLTLLSNLSVGLLTIIDRTLEGVFRKFVGGMQTLMASQIQDVRRLAAKANAWFCSSSQLASLIKTRVWKIVTFINDRSVDNEIKSENELHGFLLNTRFLYGRFREEKEGITKLKEQEEQVRQSIDELKSVKDSDNVSFVCRAILCELAGYDQTLPAGRQIEDVLAMLQNITSNQSLTHLSIGVFDWASVVIGQVIEGCNSIELPGVLQNCLLGSRLADAHRPAIAALQSRLEKPLVNNILHTLIKFLSRNSSESSQVLELILDILEKFNGEVNISGEWVSEVCNNEEIKNRSASLGVLCGLLGNCVECEGRLAEEILGRLAEASDPACSDLEARTSAARGLALLHRFILASSQPHFIQPQVWVGMKRLVWEAGVRLLQDEDSWVRARASQFVTGGHNVNPYIALQSLLAQEMVLKLLPVEEALASLWGALKCSGREMASLDCIQDESSPSVTNPYDLGVPNIYEERVKIIDMASTTLLTIVSRESDYGKLLIKQEVLPCLKQLRDQCLKFIVFSGDHVLANNAMLNNDWYVVSKKLSQQCKVINIVNNYPGLNELDFEIFQYRFESYLEQLHLSENGK